MFRLIVIILLYNVVFCENSQIKTSPPQALQGYINLSGWNFQKNGPIQLRGEWEFYWMNFYSFQAFQTTPAPVADTFINCPGQWKNMRVNDAVLPLEGFATLRLKVRIDSVRSGPLAIKISHWSNPLTLYINDKKLTSVGIIGTSSASEIYDSRPHIARFIPPSDSFDILLQVSNYTGKKASCSYPIYLGLDTQLQSERTTELSCFLIIFGAISFIGLCLLLAFSSMRPINFALLYLGLSCVVISLRSVFMGEALINDLFPFLPSYIKFKIELSLLYSFVVLINMYGRVLFPDELKRWFIQVIVISHTFFIAVVLIFNYDIALYTQLPHHIITAFDGIYVLVVLGRAIEIRRKGAAIFMISLSIIFISAVHDILVFHHMIETPYLIHFGFLVFIVIQTLLVTYIYSKSSGNISILTEKLDTANDKNRVLRKSSDLENVDLTLFYQLNKITCREKDIIELIIAGASNNEIAEKLFISFHTVRSHLNNIYRKCKISERSELLTLVKKMATQNKSVPQ